MKKKWWLFTFLVIVLVVSVTLIYLGATHKKIVQIPGGLVIVATEDIVEAGSSTPSQAFPGAPPDKTEVDVNKPEIAEGTPMQIPIVTGCWKCSLDSLINNLDELGISLEDLAKGGTTQCRVSEAFIQIDCVTEEVVPVVCGNGICENGEVVGSETNCPADCSPTPSAVTENTEEASTSEGGSSDSESHDSTVKADSEQTQTEQRIDTSGFVGTCLPNGRFVLVAELGAGQDEVQHPEECLTQQTQEANEPSYSPYKQTLLERLISKLLGLP